MLTRPARRLGAVVALAMGLGIGPAWGEVERVEVIGTIPAREHAPPGVPPRQAALEAGVREAVVAAGLREALRAQAVPDADAVAEALGGNPFPYAVSFRVLEDRGERRAVLSRDPEVEWEYVVLIEVQIDLDRVREGLAEAALLAPAAPGGPLRAVRVVLEGLTRYPSYRAIRDSLAGAARSVRPLEFAPGRALLEVQTERTPAELLDRLLADLPEGLTVTPIEIDADELRIRAVHSVSQPRTRALFGGADLGAGEEPPPSPAGGPAPIDTPRPKRY